ncbi:MAG: DUF998 domain-containing protein [Anaerolineae bacterium]
METTAALPNMIQRVLLFCGILAPLLTFGIDRVGGRLLKGYSFTAQSMSELSASGASTRPLVVPLTVVSSALMIAFGVGVLQADHAFLPRVVGGLVIGNAVAGLIATVFFPTHFGERPAFGTANVIIMLLSVVCFVLAMVVGAAAFRGWFRALSIAIPVAYVLLAVLRFTTASPAAEGAAVSMVGAQERTMGYSFLLWVMALAIHLLLLTGKGVD